MSLVSDGVAAMRHDRSKRLALTAAAILLIGAAVAGILVATSGSSSPKPAAESTTGSVSQPAATVVGTTVQAVSVTTLRALPGTVGHPVYWAGPRPGTTYELTRSPDGRVYVRYLTGGAKVGSPLPDFLTVGTYVVPNAAAAVRAAAAQPGAVRVPVPGGVGFYNSARPTSVYFAHPGSNVQVETYDPSAAVARQLVESGTIRPVG
jgi:hypothetical protein